MEVAPACVDGADLDAVHVADGAEAIAGALCEHAHWLQAQGTREPKRGLEDRIALFVDDVDKDGGKALLLLLLLHLLQIRLRGLHHHVFWFAFFVWGLITEKKERKDEGKDFSSTRVIGVPVEKGVE